MEGAEEHILVSISRLRGTMSTKPKFLQDIEKKLAKNKENGDEGLEIYREVFTKLIENIHTFGPVMASVKSGYESHIRYIILQFFGSIF